MPLKVRRHTDQSLSPGRLVLKLDGHLDESAEDALAELQKMAATAPEAGLAIELSGVGLINSIGVQRWLECLRSLPARVSYEFHGCTLGFVEYACMLPSFLGRGQIVSFDAAVCCVECDHQATLRLRTDFLKNGGGYKALRCSKCGGKVTGVLSYEDLRACLLPPGTK